MMKINSLFLLSMLFLLSCTETEQKQKVVEVSKPNDKLIMATLYNYFAPEYMALAHQAYNIATDRVDQLHAEHPDRSDMAIVLDIDETILDNSPYEAEMIKSGNAYSSDTWEDWCNLAAARPVPGALAFLKHADSLGFNIFYVSNRKLVSEQEGTVKNLISLGFPQIEEAHLMLKEEKSVANPDPGNKETRRKSIEAQGYEIVLFFGDNLGDFFEDEKPGISREKLMETYLKNYGHKFIVLPNAMYGNWPKGIGIKDAHSIDSLIGIMTELISGSKQ